MTPETSRLASELLPLARKVAQAAGQLLMQRPTHFDLTEKSVAIDFATQMDEKAEALIVESILAERPDDGIIGEEGAARERHRHEAEDFRRRRKVFKCINGYRKTI